MSNEEIETLVGLFQWATVVVWLIVIVVKLDTIAALLRRLVP